MRVRAAAVAMVMLCAAGCREPELRPIEEGLTASPERLVFESAWVGYSTSAELELSVPGRVALEVTVEVPPPFRVQTPRLQIHPGSTVRVPVEFAPVKKGVFQAVARISGGEWVLEVPLDGVARAVPLCLADGVCQRAEFDPVLGQCLRTSAPNGTHCSLPCVSNAVCVEGSCSGTPATCDDGNACTSDACDVSAGCVHQPVACEDVADPCQAPSCDPLLGCTTVSVADGMRCGRADCSVSDVCIGGACVPRPTPEGGACQVSPCADPGVCNSGVCKQPLAHPLEPAWVYQPPPGSTLHFPGVIDGMGNHYWLECIGGTCSLASATHEGVLRGRWMLEHSEGVGSEAAGTMILANDLLVMTHSADWVEARRLDGSPAWSRHLLGELLPDFRRSSSERRVEPFRAVFDGIDQVVVRVSHAPAMDESEGCWLVALDVTDGEPRWKRHYPQRCMDSLVSAADGTVVFGTFRQVGSNLADFELRALDRLGVELWARAGTSALPLAALGNNLVEHDTFVSRVTTGGPLFQVFASETVAEGGEDPVTPLLGGNAGFVMRSPSPAVGYTLDRFSLQTGGLYWSMGLPMRAPYFVQPLLTDQGHVLVAGGMPASTASRLREISADGELVFDCPLAAPGPASGVAALHAGRWVVPVGAGPTRSLAAYDLPGLAPASSGWTGLGGNPARTGMALP